MSKLPTISIAYASDATENVSTYFNKILNNSDKDWCLFIAPDITFDESYVLKKIQGIVQEYPDIVCVYSDNITTQDASQHKLYYPAYYYNMCDNVNINTPLCCSTKTETRFDVDMQYLYYLDFLNRVSRTGMCWHIPEFLFTTPVIQQNEIVQQELDRIYEQSS